MQLQPHALHTRPRSNDDSRMPFNRFITLHFIQSINHAPLLQGSNYYGAVHDEAEQPQPLPTMHWADSASAAPLQWGQWSGETRDVLDGASCGGKPQEHQKLRVRGVAEVRLRARVCRRGLQRVTPCVLQRLCEECKASCTGISSADEGACRACCTAAFRLHFNCISIAFQLQQLCLSCAAVVLRCLRDIYQVKLGSWPGGCRIPAAETFLAAAAAAPSRMFSRGRRFSRRPSPINYQAHSFPFHCTCCCSPPVQI